jgi:hypothetical protein
LYIYKHQTTPKKDKLVGVIKSNIKTTTTSRPFGMMVCNGPLRWFLLAVLGPSANTGDMVGLGNLKVAENRGLRIASSYYLIFT